MVGELPPLTPVAVRETELPLHTLVLLAMIPMVGVRIGLMVKLIPLEVDEVLEMQSPLGILRLSMA
jgi:hypothetical protein